LIVNKKNQSAANTYLSAPERIRTFQRTKLKKILKIGPLVEIKNFINNSYCAAISGRQAPIFDPSNGSQMGTYPSSDTQDVAAAVEAAKAAAPAWALWQPEQRFDVLMAISNGIMARLDELATLESRDSGKTIKTASTVDIPRAALNFKFFATAAMHWASESHYIPGHALSYTLRQPIGVVGCISPWNLPLYLFTWKIAPALATGNCVVAKPSEVTPVTASILGQIAKEAGLPAGVLNIVQGDGPKTGAAIVAHRDVKAISFTGSTRAGAEIARVAAPMFKKLSLELGGKNAALIFADCDYDRMLDTVVRSAFSNQGQICLCASRLYVEISLFERFRTDFVQRVQQLRVGHPSDPTSDLGAVVSATHFDKIMGCIETAKAEGGRILCGGQPATPTDAMRGGWYIEPTVIESLPLHCQTNQQEIFGPVVTIAPFEHESEAIELANGTAYGLSATVWTNNLLRANHVAARLEAGIVWINTWMLRDLRTPFGGVKDSGVGREGGWEAMRFFTEAKNVTIGEGG
jgi:aminomuconate-semialdehyde/2-hydroxymuconate-6-semialdehyde dehydrogenase